MTERDCDHPRNCECRACEVFLEKELRQGWGPENRSTLGEPQPSCGARTKRYPSLDEMDGNWGGR